LIDVTQSRDPLLERLKRMETGQVYDVLKAMGLYQSADARIRPIGAGYKVAGRAYTIGPVVRDAPEGGGKVDKYKTMSQDKERVFGDVKPGDVVVVTMGGMGENTACAIKTRGGVGIIVDGYCRDIQGIRESLKIPCFCSSISPGDDPPAREGGTRVVSTESNIPVECGGVRVSPGDVVLADDSGIVFIPGGIFEETLEFMEAYAELDDSVSERLLEGASVGEAYGAKVDWAKRIGLTEYLKKKSGQ